MGGSRRMVVQWCSTLGIFMLLLSGCWNRNELNELAIVLALGIDKVGNEYEVSVQVMDPTALSRNRSTSRAPITVYSEKESTIFEALRKITTKSSRRMYVAHLRYIVFDEAAARAGIREPLDFLFRDQEVRPDFYMAVAKKCKAKDVVGFVSSTEVLPGMDMYKSLKTSEKAWSPTSAVNVKELMIKIASDGIEPVLTGIALFGDIAKGKTLENARIPIPPAEYVYQGIGLFRDDRLIDWMNEDESRGYSYITNNTKSSVIKSKCPDEKGYFNVELIRSQAKRKVSIRGGAPHVVVQVKAVGNIGEVQCSVDITDPEVFQKLQNAASEKLHYDLNNSIKKGKEHGVDVFGFGEEFHRKYPKLWKKWKDNWNDVFQHELTYEIEAEYQLRLHGKINNPFTDLKIDE